jgi:NADH-quinone oxidoreductase subunit C
MLEALKVELESAFSSKAVEYVQDRGELTLIVPKDALLDVATLLRDRFQFEQLIDVAGIDYSTFGTVEWNTETATSTGFSRGVEPHLQVAHEGSRFAVAYQLLSYARNLRVRLKCFLDDEWPKVDSLTSLWSAANWFEREAFDLFGIIFKNHPDLRRILTDYGFIGHPFRKDFPLSGHVEVRYDAATERVVYKPVEIEPRILVPKVIRHDNRYVSE